MSPPVIALGAAFCILPLIVGGGLLFNSMRSDRRLAARFAALHRPARSVVVVEAAPAESVRMIAIRIVSGIGDRVLRLLSSRTKDDVETMLRGAGHSGNAALRLFVGAKILLLVALPAGMWVVTGGLETAGTTRMIATAAAAVAGLLAPDMAVRKLRDARMKRIQDQLPDALDLMVICAQAGLGLGTTIVRVAHELQQSHRAVALELAQTANEMQMMTDGKAALVNLGNRCGVDSAKRLAATLVQSTQYGTPLTEALRALAAELRLELVTRFEARAARMPVLLTLPMILFILPCVFLVVGGPIFVQVKHAF
ncbi:MAG: type II secretion system F family protein [Rhodopila sp.]|nr:type II secretion system F family protein [Rhodopila sp.]